MCIRVVVVGIRNSYHDRDYIGFATLPEQVHRKSVKRGFDFTLMVVGETGLGKSTLINSLFMNDLYKNRAIPSVEERLERTTQIEKKQMEIEERGVKLRLTIVDTPGFGDSINSDESWRTVISYIDDQVNNYCYVSTVEHTHKQFIAHMKPFDCCIFMVFIFFEFDFYFSIVNSLPMRAV